MMKIESLMLSKESMTELRIIEMKIDNQVKMLKDQKTTKKLLAMN